MASLAVLFWVAVVAVPGLVGSMLITRYLPGPRALGAFGLWLPVPFVILAMVLAADRDPTLSAGQASYNYQLALVLVSIGIAIPWAAANLAGGLIGRHRRRAALAPAPVPVVRTPSTSPPDGGDPPDWSHPDSPLLSLGELGLLMRGIAARAGIAEHGLPDIGQSDQRDCVFIERDKFDYIYCELERGGAVFDHRMAVADQLMYLIFKDRAWALATTHMARNPTTPGRYARLHADKQQEVLAGIEPRWGRQFALERACKAGG